MTTSNSALQLCSDSLMKHFNQTYLNSLEIMVWHRKLGTKDKLQYAEQETFSAVFVDADLSYSKENLLCWSRVLQNNGLLLLEKIQEKTPEMLTALFPEQLFFVENHNPEIWIFVKRSTDFTEIYTQITDKLEEKEPLKTLYPLLEKLEWANPHLASANLLRNKLFAQYDMEFVVSDYWQNYVDRTLTHMSKIYASLHTLLRGDYQAGFVQREWVMRNSHLRRTSTPPQEKDYEKRWKGENLSSKTIVIWTEFGLGDEIMFAQLAYYLKLQGAKTLWIVQKPIVSLLKSHPYIDQVIASDQIEQTLCEFDYWAYPHEILAHIPIPFQHLPKHQPYLFAEPRKRQKAETVFSDSVNLKVGIVWRGDPTHENDRFRSIHDLNYIETLFKIEGIDWYCMQKACNEQEIQLLEKYNIVHLAKDFNDFSDTAAALSHIDCLVAVDTSVVHAAGAMGIPSLLMLPYIGDWRWGSKQIDSIWYPNIQIFRCNMPIPNWDNVIPQVKKALLERINWKKRAIK